MMNEQSRLEKTFVNLAPWLIGIASVLLIILIYQISKTGSKVAETEAYTRVTNCIVAKSANPEFTQDEIERCYIQVEKNTGESLERFDFQTKGEN